MASIKITEKNEARITAAIKEAEGRAHQRTVSIEMVKSDIAAAEEELAGLQIPKQYWEGTVILTEVSFRLANSYGYCGVSTTVRVVRDKGSWKFNRADRGPCGKTGGSRVRLSDEAKAHIPSQYDI